MKDVGQLTVGVVGLGPMGRGIATVFAAGHATVRCLDVTAERTEQGVADVASQVEGPAQVVAAPDLRALTVGADLVIEAVAEDLELKRSLLEEIGRHATPELVVASNTSSLSIAEMARMLDRPERFVGMHFFNPPTRMRLIEVVRGPSTAAEIVASVCAWAVQLGKTPVVCTDSPNFVVNRVCRPLYYEGQLLVTQGVDPAVVDLVAREVLGHRMGPLELVDLTGLHTHLRSSETAFREFGDPRYRPIPIVRQLVRAGRTGRESRHGFYDYETRPPRAARAEVAFSALEGSSPVEVLGPTSPTLSALDRAGSSRATALYRCGPTATDLDHESVRALASAGRRVVVDSSDARWRDMLPAGAGWLRLHRTARGSFAEVVVDPLVGLERNSAIEDVLTWAGAASVNVLALPGLVADRLACCLINEAVSLVEEGGAAPDDIDTALRLGMNHPAGPFELLRDRGPGAVVDQLASFCRATGDPRYRPHQYLLRLAAGERRTDRSAS